MTAEASAAVLAVAVLTAIGLGTLFHHQRIGLAGMLGAGAVYALIAVGVWRGLPRHAPHAHFGSANIVTTLRAGFAAILAGLALEEALAGAGLAVAPLADAGAWRWGLAAAAAGALALDGADGWIARRQRLVSAFGARFDMEVDALFILALSVIALASGRAGPWVLAAGFLRYGFVAAGRLWPALAAPLPPSFRRKAACVFLAISLIAALAPPAPMASARILAAAAVAGIVGSFALDTIRLVRRRDERRPSRGLTVASLGAGRGE